ncbi:MAG: ABC transporter permease [candidate division KSB1 bacterium]
MNKMWTALRREYLSRVKTKGFIIGTILFPVFLGVMFVVPTLMMLIKSDKPKQIAVVDQTGEILDSLRVALSDTNETGERLYNLLPHEAPNLDAAQSTLKASVQEGGLDGYIIIPSAIYEQGVAEYYGKTVTNFRENDRIEGALNRVVTDKRLQRSGMEPERVRDLMRAVNLKAIPLTEDGKEGNSAGATFAIAYFLGFFIYMAMFIYGALLQRSVIEEKTSRVIESVISSIKPFHLMAAKILGVGAVGLTQFLIWAVVMGLLSLYGVQVAGIFAPKAGAASGAALPTVSMGILFFFVLFFVLGYFLYATIYAGVGAMVNSEQEAQQFMMPISMFIIAPILLIMYVIGNPDSQASVLLSLVPFFAPILMLARIVVATPPAWQIILCLALMIATIVGLIWVVGRVYRVGVLMYGKRPTLPELLKWIRYA